jgi:hypothetical protein
VVLPYLVDGYSWPEGSMPGMRPWLAVSPQNRTATLRTTVTVASRLAPRR